MCDMSDIERLRRACDMEDIVNLLQYVKESIREERESEEFHRRIWDARTISGVGIGENINIGQAIGHTELRSWLAEESLRELPNDRYERADTLEEIRLDLLERVTSIIVDEENNRRPLAKITRLLAALFPEDFTTLFGGKLDEFIRRFNESFPTISIEPQGGSIPSKHRQILDKLDEALERVPDDDLEALTHRMTLPIRLLKPGKLPPKPKATDDSDKEISPLTEETSEVEVQNIILYGPPGTGKTYSTTQRALELLGEGNIDGRESKELKDLFRKYQEKGQIEFVTFHQSYGYEEFVEGLRPVLDEDEGDDVRYELHNGVFKRIALRAAAEGLPKPTEGPDFDDLWDRLVADIREEDERIVYSKSENSYIFRLSNLSNPRSIKICRCEVDEEDNIAVTNKEQTASKEKSKVLWDQRNTFREQPENLTQEKANQIFGVSIHYTALWIVYKHLFDLNSDSAAPREDLLIDDTVRWVQQALDQSAADSASFSFSTKTPQYVLIIDEINRGNVSKILGELITLLEPDKRLGAENELRLPLSYSPEKRFGIPPNLHILGTMNTADRSIALMDVALRRRFTFEELMPDAAVIRENLGKGPRVDLFVDLFETLNKRIRFLYDRDHQLGHAYFLGVKDWKSLRLVFINRVIPLLQEYFYGDWYKICTVLGCPYDEDGKPSRANKYPIVEASKFPEKDTLGFDHDEYEDRVDFSISSAFQNKEMSEEHLARTFFGVLSAKQQERWRDALEELIGSDTAADTEEGEENGS